MVRIFSFILYYTRIELIKSSILFDLPIFNKSYFIFIYIIMYYTSKMHLNHYRRVHRMTFNFRIVWWKLENEFFIQFVTFELLNAFLYEWIFFVISYLKTQYSRLKWSYRDLVPVINYSENYSLSDRNANWKIIFSNEPVFLHHISHNLLRSLVPFLPFYSSLPKICQE